MGYKRPRRVVDLQLGEKFEGLEVRMRGLSTGDYLKVSGMRELDADDNAYYVVHRFAECLVSWTLEDEDGQPIPATTEAVYEQELDFVMALAGEWIDALGGVPAPLEPSSPAGEPSLAGSIPMEILSSALVS